MKLRGRYFFLFFLYAAFLSFVQCSIDADQPIAKVGGEKLSVEDIDFEKFQFLPDSARTVVLLNYVNTWVDEELLYQEAKRQQVRLAPYMEAELERVRKAMLTTVFLNERFSQLITVSDQEIQSFYDENPNEFIAESDYYKFHALKLTERSFERAIERKLVEGTAIFDVYEEFPDNCEIVSSGRTFLNSNELPSELTTTLSRNTGNSNFSKTNVGGQVFFIKHIDSFKEGTSKDFALVKDEIRNTIMLTKRREKHDDLINRLRQNIEFEINIDILMDIYSNR